MSLKQKMLKGGAYLVVRQIAGVIITGGGTLLITRLLGPAQFGRYFSVYGIIFLLYTLASFGVREYLVRKEDDPESIVYDQATSFLLISGIAYALIGLGCAPLMIIWIKDQALLEPIWVMMLTIPFSVLHLPAVARLERQINFQRVATIELVFWFIYYGLAIIFALLGWGIWAMIAGYAIAHLYQLVHSYIWAGFIPRWRWSWRETYAIANFGIKVSLSLCLSQVQLLLLPSMIVGRYLGMEAVGLIAVTSRLISSIGFVSQIMWRLTVVGFAKIQSDLKRVGSAVEEIALLQSIVIGALLAGFGVVGPVLLPWLLGPEWSAAMTVYPFLAFTALANALFSPQASALYVLNEGQSVLATDLAYTVLLAVAGLVLVPIFGLYGWGLAQMLSVPSFLLLHLASRRHYTLSYTRALAWIIGFVPLLFTSLIAWPYLLILPIALIVPLLTGRMSDIRYYWLSLQARL
jgi:O-antigen/teichoic acid export membrane protein